MVWTSGCLPEDGLVEVAQELHGLQVLPPSIPIGYPLPLLAGVVQIEHRGHRVHAQPVHVVDVQPVEGAREQEGAHLVPSIVEDVALPVLVEALTGILVLVEVGSVEIRQGEAVRGEMGRDPVEDHAQASLVEVVYQIHEILGGTEAARGGEVAGGLVSPGCVVGVAP